MASAQTALWEPVGLRFSGGRAVDLATNDLGPFSAWSGGIDLLWRWRASAVGWPEDRRWQLVDVGDRPDTGLRLPAPGTGTASRVLSAIVERTEGPGVELAIRQAGAWGRVVNSGARTLDVGTGWASVRPRGIGPDGGQLEEIALAWPRADGQEIWLLPAGRAVAAGSAIVHHLQYDTGASWGGYVPPDAGGTLAEDTAVMAAAPGGTRAIAATAPLDTAARHVLWQRDDGSDAHRLSLAAAGGRLVLDASDGRTLDLGALAPGDAFSLVLDLSASPPTVARDLGVPRALAPGALPAATTERLGGAAAAGSCWQGWISRAEAY